VLIWALDFVGFTKINSHLSFQKIS